MSPVCLYEVGVEDGGKQEDGQLQHTTQPEEHRTGNHGNHTAQHHVLYTRKMTNDHTVLSSI